MRNYCKPLSNTVGRGLAPAEAFEDINLKREASYALHLNEQYRKRNGGSKPPPYDSIIRPTNQVRVFPPITLHS